MLQTRTLTYKDYSLRGVISLAAAGLLLVGTALPLPAQIFTNPAPIMVSDAIADTGEASPYPATINVSGLSGTITRVTVTLHNLSHTYPDDIDVLLVGPGGNIILMSDAGGGSELEGVSLVFDDTAASMLPDEDQITSGTFLPTNDILDENFPPPAPSPSDHTMLAQAFSGTAPNGTWHLYIIDDTNSDVGTISDGWSVTVTTDENPATTFANTNNLFINDPAGKGSPYPSVINVSGVSQNVASVKVTLHSITHEYPDDLDFVLVGPGGTKFLFMSDAGGSSPISDVTLTLDDDANTGLPNNGPLLSGRYRPANYPGGSDAVPNNPPPYLIPEPAGAASFSSAFGGSNPNGVWQLYVSDDKPDGTGGIAGGWSLAIEPLPDARPPLAGELLISEFRLRGPNGAADEFVEVYNATNTPLLAQGMEGSPGVALVASDGVVRSVIPNGTSIPAHGHYLCANSAGYSVASYPAGNDGVSDTFANPDATYTADIPDNAGLALFTSTTNFSSATRLDAVGPTTEGNPLFKEGAGLPALTTANLDYSFSRRHDRLSGRPVDTDANASDFVFVETNGSSAGGMQRLGAAGPENMTSPVLRNGYISVTPVQPCTNPSAPPNRVYDPTDVPGEPNDSFGRLEIRRLITNHSGAPITRLRFRLINLSTYPNAAGVADLRALNSSDATIAVQPACGAPLQMWTVHGTTLEEAPMQPKGGGVNSSVSLAPISLGDPLLAGDSIAVRVVFGVQATGSFNFAFNVEALPGGPTRKLRITEVRRLPNRHFFLQGFGIPNAVHTLQTAAALNGLFNDFTPVTADATGVVQYDDATASIATPRFYRLGTPAHEVSGTVGPGSPIPSRTQTNSHSER